MQAPGDAARAEHDAGAGADAQAAPRHAPRLTVVARTDRERQDVLAAIGPVWDRNEVWLIAGGGALSVHGALFLVFRNEGAVRERALWAAHVLWPTMTALGLVAIGATEIVRPEIYRQLLARPWAWPLALLALAGLIGAPWLRDLRAFNASSAFLAGTLAATAAGMFPVLLPSTLDPAFAITAAGAAAGEHSQSVALGWWGIGIAFALAYTAYIYRSLRGKAVASEH